MSINDGCYANMANTTLVKKLNLNTIKHPRPYIFQWLNEFGEMNVSKQVLVLFFIGKYSDEVLYDVIPMHTSHLLLGRLWWFEMRVVHDVFKNRYLFVKDEKFITLVPLSLKQFYDNQLKLKRNSKAEESENRNLIASLEMRERLDSAKKKIRELVKSGEKN